MTRFALHVPVLTNTGESVPESTLFTIEESLLTISDGFTMTPGIGAWRAPDGRIYRESVNVYALDIDGDPHEARTALTDLAEWVASTLEQEAVYVTEQHTKAARIQPAALPV